MVVDNPVDGQIITFGDSQYIFNAEQNSWDNYNVDSTIKKSGVGYTLDTNISKVEYFGTLGREALNFGTATSPNNYGALGDNSLVIGVNNTAKGNNSFIFGKYNISEGLNSIVGGSYNSLKNKGISIGDYNKDNFFPNVSLIPVTNNFRYYSTFLSFYKTSEDNTGLKESTNNKFILGLNRDSSILYLYDGVYDTIDNSGSRNDIIVTNSNDYIIDNKINDNKCSLFLLENANITLNDDNNFWDIEILTDIDFKIKLAEFSQEENNDFSISLGQNILNTNIDIALGYYNKNDKNNILEIGNGDDSKRTNAFSIGKDGLAYIQEGKSVDSKSKSNVLINKNYLDNRIKGIQKTDGDLLDNLYVDFEISGVEFNNLVDNFGEEHEILILGDTKNDKIYFYIDNKLKNIILRNNTSNTSGTSGSFGLDFWIRDDKLLIREDNGLVIYKWDQYNLDFYYYTTIIPNGNTKEFADFISVTEKNIYLSVKDVNDIFGVQVFSFEGSYIDLITLPSEVDISNIVKYGNKVVEKGDKLLVSMDYNYPLTDSRCVCLVDLSTGDFSNKTIITDSSNISKREEFYIFGESMELFNDKTLISGYNEVYCYSDRLLKIIKPIKSDEFPAYNFGKNINLINNRIFVSCEQRILGGDKAIYVYNDNLELINIISLNSYYNQYNPE